MANPHGVSALTLRDRLLQSRLIHREARLQLALAALHDRRRELERHDTEIPKPLLAAIAGFEEELAGVRDGLRGTTSVGAGRASPSVAEAVVRRRNPVGSGADSETIASTGERARAQGH